MGRTLLCSTGDYTCSGCGIHVKRKPTKGQRPKWCPDCRARSAWSLTTFECQGCGDVVTASGKKYCSQLCRVYVRFGPQVCKWSPPKPPKPPKPTSPRRPALPPFTPETRECGWCGTEFLAHRRDQTYCTGDHKIRAKRVRRRGRQYGSTSHFTWAEFMRVFIAFDRCCAYCEQKVDGQPDPDHVVPLSQGGSNSITNILPACRLCNSDKRDLSLSEWARDRAARGKPPRTTTWALTDSRVQHLTVTDSEAA